MVEPILKLCAVLNGPRASWLEEIFPWSCPECRNPFCSQDCRTKSLTAAKWITAGISPLFKRFAKASRRSCELVKEMRSLGLNVDLHNSKQRSGAGGLEGSEAAE